MADVPALLNDHAHLEKKAAANALTLLTAWPESSLPDDWAARLTSVADDEIAHLAQVLRILHRRQSRLSRRHHNPYAAALHRYIETGVGMRLLQDRLLISALIEARSCERFSVLAEHCPDAELAALYRGLFASEAGHYRLFLDLAAAVPGAPDPAPRWDELLVIEADVLAVQTPGSRMHSGM